MSITIIVSKSRSSPGSASKPGEQAATTKIHLCPGNRRVESQSCARALAQAVAPPPQMCAWYSPQEDALHIYIHTKIS